MDREKVVTHTTFIEFPSAVSYYIFGSTWSLPWADQVQTKSPSHSDQQDEKVCVTDKNCGFKILLHHN